jgi:hypothetical protein
VQPSGLQCFFIETNFGRFERMMLFYFAMRALWRLVRKLRYLQNSFFDARMHEIIELALESPDGIVDCRLEPDDSGSFYAVTILYPTTAGGYTRSDIFCHNLMRDAETGAYFFEGEDVHPKIKRLEAELSAAIKTREGK